MDEVNTLLAAANAVLWHDYALYILLGTGVLFTVWSGFAQYRALTHGVQVTRGIYDNAKDPGAINHFQALSAAISATVGLGNIGGVALAIALGGPGAVFWMWVVGFFGMAIKLTEVTLSMMYRNTDQPDNPHGGPMWVASKGFARLNPKLAGVGKVWGGIFCITLLVSTITGGNMFQAWNVGDITEEYFGVPSVAAGIVMAVLVAAVIIGGIKRIGAVAALLVPFMIGLYLLAAIYVLVVDFGEIPRLLALIFTSAFSAQEGTGAFIGGTVGYAFLFGMKRALFSNEAGQGSSPIAHSAAKTDEPVREGVVAGLEPFIDTLIVCTITALVILITGVWNRTAESSFAKLPEVVPVAADVWSLETVRAPQRETDAWREGEAAYVIVKADRNPRTGNKLHRLDGNVFTIDGEQQIVWSSLHSSEKPELVDGGVYATYVGATLTAKAFDTITPGLGKWLITLASWLFAISTMISWSYYGEQGMVYLLGERSVLPYQIVYCILIVVATMGFIETNAQLDNLTGFGTGVMLFANVPLMWIFGRQAMRVYHEYMGRLRDGRMGPDHARPRLEDVISGRDVS